MTYAFRSTISPRAGSLPGARSRRALCALATASAARPPMNPRLFIVPPVGTSGLYYALRMKLAAEQLESDAKGREFRRRRTCPPLAGSSQLNIDLRQRM